MNIHMRIKAITSPLKNFREIQAIVLAGSHATNTARPDSDIDIGIYYNEHSPPVKEKLERVLLTLTRKTDMIVTDIGEWGKWMDGGAWLKIDGIRVDLIYRNLQILEKVIDDSINGKIETDFYQQPAFGYFSYMYCAETKVCKVLYDPDDILLKLKEKVRMYPPKLKEKIINHFLWDAQFSFAKAQKTARRGELYIVAGCLTRVVNDLVQVLYALNETFFFGEKKLYSDFLAFKIKPDDFIMETQKVLAHIGGDKESLQKNFSTIRKYIDEFLTYSKEWYKPRFKLDLDKDKL